MLSQVHLSDKLLYFQSSKPTTAGAQLDKSKNISKGQPSPRQERGTSLTPPTPATPRPNPLSARQRQGTQRGLECRTSRVQQIQQKNNAGGAHLLLDTLHLNCHAGLRAAAEIHGILSFNSSGV